MYHVQESISVREDVAERQQEHDQRDPTDILRNQRHHRNHCHHCINHMYEPTSVEDVQGASSDRTDNPAREEQKDGTLQRNRCPHHPLRSW